MAAWWKINIYEVQVLLYWILGELILHFGTWHWVGWISIGYGWLTFAYVIVYAYKRREEIGAYDLS